MTLAAQTDLIAASTLRPVLVAVDPTGALPALEAAAAAAVRAAVPVHVLLVASFVDPAAHREQDDRVLAGAVAEVTARVGGAVPVSGELAYGDAVGRVVASGRSCGLTVLQRSHGLERGRTSHGQTCVQVAAHSTGPVLTVPWSWDQQSRRGTMVVGLPDGGVSAARLLGVALTQAARGGAALRVVHAVRSTATNAELLVLRGRLDDLVEEEGAGHDVALVEVGIDLVRGRAAEVLLAAADGAELLVVARRLPDGAGGTLMGAVASSLVARSTCPVLVVPTDHDV